MPACRDLPKVVVAVALEHLLFTEDDLKNDPGYRGSAEIDTMFGMSDRTHLDYFPASAWRGPFLPLLKNHPSDGLDLEFAMFNHSADWYANPRRPLEIEPVHEMALTLPDGTTRRQWCNAAVESVSRDHRRPISPAVGSHGVEQWLLEVGEAYPKTLDALLLQILRGSDSVALTAVVASVATAFSHEGRRTPVLGAVGIERVCSARPATARNGVTCSRVADAALGPHQ